MLGGNAWTPPACHPLVRPAAGTVERLLAGKAGGLGLGVAALGPVRPRRAIYFDAFGWRFAEQHGDHPLLRMRPPLERLTSQFPRRRPCTPTIHSGQPVGEAAVRVVRVEALS